MMCVIVLMKVCFWLMVWFLNSWILKVGMVNVLVEVE